MARTARSEIFSPDEITHLHLMARVMRRYYLLGDDPVTGRNCDHRKVWIEEQLAPIFARLSLSSEAWCRLASDIGRMFHVVAGQPRTIEGTRSRRRHPRYRVPKATRERLRAKSIVQCQHIQERPDAYDLVE